MYLQLDLSDSVSCTRFGRMMQKNQWNRLGIAQKSVNLLVFVISGGAVFTFNGEDHPVAAGDVLLIPAKTPYSANTDDMCDYYFFHFTGQLVPVDQLPQYPAMERDFSFDLPPVPHKNITLMQKTSLETDYGRFYQCVVSCADLHAGGSFSGRLALDVELSKLLLMLSQILERQHRAAAYPMALEQMLEYIRRNLTKPLTTSELCRYCGVSASYAARLFKNHLNTTMTQYITDQKLYYACELMRNTGMNISQIASFFGLLRCVLLFKTVQKEVRKIPDPNVFPQVNQSAAEIFRRHFI